MIPERLKANKSCEAIQAIFDLAKKKAFVKLVSQDFRMYLSSHELITYYDKNTLKLFDSHSGE